MRMPDMGKVIMALEKALAISEAVDSGYIWITIGDGRKALELLKEQLKKQEAKPVKITKNAYNYEFYHCPNCDRGFELTYYKRPAFCDKCGQELKWDD